MKKDKDVLSPKNDFQDFLRTAEELPPREVSEAILSRVRQELSPSLFRVSSKLLGVHLVASLASLQICSQFGVGRMTALTHVFMGFGEAVCMLACGAVFLGLTALVASLWLSVPELVVLRKAGYLPILGLGLISLVVFAALGEGMLVSLALLWFMGGIVAAVGATELGLRLRREIVVSSGA